MSDWISREDALEILEDEGWVGDSLRRIHALPAVQSDAVRLRKLLDDIIDEYDGHMFGPIMTSINAARAELEGV